MEIALWRFRVLWFVRHHDCSSNICNQPKPVQQIRIVPPILVQALSQPKYSAIPPKTPVKILSLDLVKCFCMTNSPN